MTNHNIQFDPPKNLLIVEDEERAAKALKQMLEMKGKYRVFTENSGENAVNKVLLIGEEIGVILMDIKMTGEIDGIEAVRKIQEKYPQIPVILVTAFAHDEEFQKRVRDLRLNIVDWVDKPITRPNQDKLLGLIESEIKKQIKSEIEKHLRYFLETKLDDKVTPHVIQSLVEKLSSTTHELKLLIEVIKEMKEEDLSKMDTDELFPYLNFMAYQNMRDELESKYSGQFVAFLDGEHVKSNPIRNELIRDVYEFFNRTDFLITQITGKQDVIKIRQPRRIN